MLQSITNRKLHLMQYQNKKRNNGKPHSMTSKFNQNKTLLNWIAPAITSLIIVGALFGGESSYGNVKNSNIITANPSLPKEITQVKGPDNLNLVSTILTAVAVSLSIIFRLDSKIEKTNQKIESIGTELNTKVDNWGTTLSNKIDQNGQEARSILIANIREHNAQINSTNKQISEIYQNPQVKTKLFESTYSPLRSV